MSIGPVRLPGRQIAPGERPSLSSRKLDNTQFLIGEVLEIDSDRQLMHVKLAEGFGGPMVVKVSQPYAGTSSYIAATPEKHSVMLIANRGNEYIPISYLPDYLLGYENKNIHKYPDLVKTDSLNTLFYRMRKLYPGEIGMRSKEGIELYLGKNFRMDDSFGDSFVLRQEDNSFISSSCNNYVFSSGIWQNSGIIRRNSIDITQKEDLQNVFREEYEDGRFSYVLRPYNSNTQADRYLAEYLLEVEDTAFGITPENDVNTSSEKAARKPIAVFSLGNMVGNNPRLGTYGKILRPVLFTDPDDGYGDFSFDPVVGDGVDTHALAISLFKPDRLNPETGAFLGIDKEGHYYQFLPSSTGGGLGKGRSMSVVARGSRKEIWGADSRSGNSWDMKTEGGLRWVLGSHDEKSSNPQKSRSMDIRASGSALYMYGPELSPDLDSFEKNGERVERTQDYYKVEKVGGKERKEVNSSRETLVGGSDHLKIDGARIEEVSGSITEFTGTNKNSVVGEIYTERVTKEKNEVFGSRKTTVTTGGVDLTVKSPKGGITEQITGVGSKRVDVNTGDIEENITQGNRRFSSASGSYEVSLNRGDIDMNVRGSGQIGLKTGNGPASIEASMGIDLKTSKASNINLRGGKISFRGRTGVMGGVVTSKSHLDYTTGAPLVGSSSVEASR